MDLIISRLVLGCTQRKKISRFIDVYQHGRAAMKAAVPTAIYSKCEIPIKVGQRKEKKKKLR